MQIKTAYDELEKKIRELEFELSEYKNNESTVNRDEQFFYPLFEKHNAIMLLIEPDSGDIVDANMAAQNFYGYSIETLKQMKIQDINLLSPEEVAQNRKQAVTEERNRFEFPHRLSNGKTRMVEVHSSPILLSGKKILLSIINDITDRKKAEREALVLKTALNQAPVGIALADENINIYYCNPEGLGMRGGEIDNLVQIPKDAFKNWQVYKLNGEPYEIENLPLVRAIVSGKLVREEFIVKHQDGTDHICDAFACPVFESEEIIGGMVIFLDITKRKKAEEKQKKLETQLLQQNAEFQAIFNSITDGIVFVDLDRRIVTINPAFKSMFGYCLNEIKGETTRLIYADSDEYFQQGKIRYFENAKGVTPVYEIEYRRKDGTIFPSETLGVPVNDAKGDTIGFLGVIRDVTVRTQRESEREITLRLLRSLNSKNDMHGLFKDITAIMKNWSGCEAVGIRLKRGNDYPYFETRGFPPEFVSAESNLCATDQSGNAILDSLGNPVLECMCGNVISGRVNSELPFFSNNGSFWTNSTTDLLSSTTEDDRQARTRNRCHGEGYESVALIPLRTGGQTLGLLQFNDPERGQFDEEKIELLEHLAASVALGLSQRLSEQALQESEERYKAIFSQAADGILLIDPATGELVAFNKKAHENLGYTEDEFRKLKIKDFETLESPEEVRRHTQTVLQNGFDSFETKHKTRDNRIIDVLVNSSAVTIGGKKLALSIFRDITLQKQSEKTLRYERDLIQRIMETSPAGITRVDAKGKIVYANKRAEKILGLNKSDIVARTYDDPAWKITDYNGKPFPIENLAFGIVKKTEKPVFDIRHAIEWPNGERVLLAINAAPLFNHEGAFDGIVATIDDVTEKNKAEQNYQMLFREMIDGFALHEIICNDEREPVDYRFLAVNPAFERLTTLKADQIIGKTVIEVLPDTEPYWIEKYGKVALTGESIEFENYSQELDRHYHTTAFQPAPNQFACMFSDITERKKSEAALQESHERFLTVLDGIEASVFVADMETYEILFMNKAMIKTFGGDLTGEKCFKALRGEKESCHFCTNKSLIDEKGAPGDVSVWEDKNPITGRWYINHTRAIKWTDGRMARIQIATDITEMREMGDRLRQAQKMEAIGNLAGGIAHDFNNILFPIMGVSEMLLEDLPSNSIEHENVLEIFNASKRGSDLVQQILAFSRQSDHKMAPIRIQHILKEVLKLSRATIPAFIEIKQHIQADCGMVMADPTQIHQIAMNLITNAYHAMEDGGGTLTIRLQEADLAVSNLDGADLAPGKYAKLMISDTGHGITADIMGKMFDPYFTTKAQGKGTGLGLSVVLGIVKEHGGDIKVSSEIGKGSTFEIFLPLMQKAIIDESADEVMETHVGTESILLVDDEAPIAKLEKQMLERFGYKVTMRVNSLEALEAFRAQPDAFDLIISDMTMPYMTGDRLAEEIRRIRRDIPIIICTGFSDRLDTEKTAKAGINGLLLKPIVKADMGKMVRKVLDNAKSDKQG